MKHAAETIQQFYNRNPQAPKPPGTKSLQMLQAQQGLKEGMLLQTQVVEPKFRDHVTMGKIM
jgi:heme-degrading monooxygenase HmoA